MARFTFSRQCKICGSPMDRIARKTWHRVLSIFIPVVHVECCERKYVLIRTKKREKRSHSENPAHSSGK